MSSITSPGVDDQQEEAASRARAEADETSERGDMAVEQVLRMFDVADEALVQLKADMQREFELGLSNEDAATIKMLITYVRELSRGDESGAYLALDLGGTNFRVLLVELNAGEAKVKSSVHEIPRELLVTQNGRELFDYIALKLLEFVQQYKLRRKRISLGFTFSFPCKQYGLTQSVLVKWCKGFKVGGVVGTDVVMQLKDALKRQLSGLAEAYIDVVAVINDTTGTLVACANTNRECRIGLIVGTGYNACYMERIEKCEKWPANYTNPKQVIINCEWGAMGDNKQRRELDKMRNEFDALIDAQSVNPQNQTYEKMVSGMYIGEMLRLAMLKLHKERALFANASVLQKLQQKDVFSGKHMSALGRDELANSTEEATKIAKDLGVANPARRDLNIMVQIASRIMHRSAHLVAAGISALLERIRKPYTVIGYDGSVIKHHPYFLRRLVDKCTRLTPKELRFEFMMSSDGSGIGAAVVAAALHKERTPLYVVRPGKVYEMQYVNVQRNASLSSSRSETTAAASSVKSFNKP